MYIKSYLSRVCILLLIVFCETLYSQSNTDTLYSIANKVIKKRFGPTSECANVFDVDINASGKTPSSGTLSPYILEDSRHQ